MSERVRGEGKAEPVKSGHNAREQARKETRAGQKGPALCKALPKGERTLFHENPSTMFKAAPPVLFRFAPPRRFGARRRAAPVRITVPFGDTVGTRAAGGRPALVPPPQTGSAMSSPAAEKRAFFADEACTGVRPRGFDRTSFGCPRGCLFIIPSFPAGGKKRRGPCSPKMKKGGNCRVYTEIVVSNWKVVVKNSSFVLAFLVSLRYNRS